MRPTTPKDLKLDELGQIERNLAEWRNFHNQPAAKRLIEFMKSEYIKVGLRDCRTVADVRARKSTMDQIRDILLFMKYDFDVREALLQELNALELQEE